MARSWLRLTWSRILLILIALHFIATFSSSSYRSSTYDSLSQLRHLDISRAGSHPDPKPNAAFVVLLRNSDLNEILWTISSLERNFNSKPWNRYPYIFLNNEPFTKHFEDMVRNAVSSTAQFGLIPKEHWDVPASIDFKLMQHKWQALLESKAPYATSISYRQMCRYQSGFFWRHPLLDDLQYYWRLEPETRHYCDFEDFDPFRFMKKNKIKYGFTISMLEFPQVIRTLWPQAWAWRNDNRHRLPERNSLKFVLKEDNIGYNRCHFWSNFEIADLSLWRSTAYRELFDYLDKTGGFFYYRWGDAPVHSIAASMLLAPEEIHRFDNIGYYHNPFSTCPRDKAARKRCDCDPESSFDYDIGQFSCQWQYDSLKGYNSTAIIESISANRNGKLVV